MKSFERELIQMRRFLQNVKFNKILTNSYGTLPPNL